MLDMDLTSVKYEVPDTTQNTNFIQLKWIQDTMVLILRTSAQVYAGCPYPMALHESGSFNLKIIMQKQQQKYNFWKF